MSRGDRIVVLKTQTDVMRGFDAVSLEVRTIARGGAMKTISRRPVLVESHLSWLARKGEYELYKTDMRRTLAALQTEFTARGYAPVVTLSLAQSGVLDFFGVPLLQTTHAKGTRIAFQHAERGRAVTIGRAKAETLALSHEREVRLSLARVAAVSMSADKRWLMVAVDTNVPLHAEVPWRRQLFILPMQRVLRSLDIPRSQLESEDVS